MIGILSNIVGFDVPRETFERLEAYVRMLIDGNTQQNLIATSTVPMVWQRHVLDSAQLVVWAPSGNWVDIGSGPGLPGIVTAILTGEPTTLVEPRRLRADFLRRVVDRLSLPAITVLQGKPSVLRGEFATLTARAVASASEMLRMTIHLSRPGTVWLLPKGRSAQKELDEVRAAWHGDFCLKPSRTDVQASILIATGVRPWGKQ